MPPKTPPSSLLARCVRNPIAVLKQEGLWPSFRIGFFAACGLLVPLLLIPNWYTSQAQVLPSQPDQGLGASPLAAAAGAVGLAFPGAPNENYDDICSSRWVAETVLNKKYNFKEKLTYFGPERAYSKTLYDYIDQKNIDLAVRTFSKKILNISQDPKSVVLNISVETHSPDLSKQVCDDVMHLLEEYLTKVAMTHGRQKAIFAEQRLAEAKEHYREARQKLEAYSYRNRTYQQSTDPTVRWEGRALEADCLLKEQLVTTLAQNLEQALLTAKDDTPILKILDRPNLPVEKSKPKRGILLIGCFLGVAAGHWVWRNRARLRASLADPAPETES